MKFNLMSMAELDKIVRGTSQPIAVRELALIHLRNREEKPNFRAPVYPPIV